MSLAIKNQSVATLLMFGLAGLMTVTVGCDKPAEPQAKKDNRGIFGKTTQEVGEFNPDGDAKVDDGKANKSHLATPGIGALAAYGPAAQRAAKMGIDKQLQIFNAMHDRYPKDHEEFMEKIIKANNVPLPVLPGGRQYQYDVENHELIVVEASEAQPESK